MKSITDKPNKAAATAILAAVLILTAYCSSCGRKPSEGDPAVSDAGSSPETTASSPEQETPRSPSDGGTSEPVTEETAEETGTAGAEGTQDPQAPQDTRDPSHDETTGGSEEPMETEAGTSDGDAVLSPNPTYEEYCAMTSEEQVAFFNSFDNIEEYFLWYEAAKADYEERNPGIEIGTDGVIIP